MHRSYRLPETDANTLALAAQIVELIIASKVTFQKADDALTAAQDMLLVKARPVIAD